MSTNDEEEERRIMRARKRRQIQREMWQMLAESTAESAAEVFRLFAWILFFIALLWLMTPPH